MMGGTENRFAHVEAIFLDGVLMMANSAHPKKRSRASSVAPRCEALERRRLLTTVINEFGGSANLTNPAGIVTGSDGNLWFTEANPSNSTIDRITPSGNITRFGIGLTSGAIPTGIAAGSDGNLWFTEYGADKIGRITTNGVITEFNVPTAASQPDLITSGPDGALWFTEHAGNKLGRIDTTGNLTEFVIPTATSQPAGITTGPDGALWFAESNTDKIGRYDPVAATFSEFSDGLTANGSPTGITTGPDGNLWFTELKSGLIGQITPSGTIIEFSMGITPNAGPAGITAGPDGNLWFTEQNVGQVARITPSGVVTEFNQNLSPTSGPAAITTGPDGNLWFTELQGNHVDRTSTTGTIKNFPTADALNIDASPQTITPGPDGALWFTNTGVDSIGRIDTAGNITEFTNGITPGGNGTAASPEGIATGPDGNLWFTEMAAGRIGRITPTGVITEFSAGLNTGSQPVQIVAGPDGNLWFTIGNNDTIGRITTKGVVTLFATGITGGASPDGITAGSDGNLWFTENAGDRIGRITTAGVVTEFPLHPISFSGPPDSPTTITSGPDGALWFTETNANRIGRITTAGVLTEYTDPGLSGTPMPEGITSGPDGLLYFGEYNDQAVASINTSGTITARYSLPGGGNPISLATGSDTNIWFTDTVRNLVDQLILGNGITPTPKNATVNATVPATITVATFQDLATGTNAANFQAVIDYGDGTIATGTILPQVTNGATVPGSYIVQGTHTYTNIGTYATKVTIGSATNAPAVNGQVFANSPLLLLPQTIDGIAGRQANTLVASIIEFDTTTFVSDLSATIQWGDGTSSTGVIEQVGSSSTNLSFSVFGAHVYSGPPKNAPVVVVTDSRNNISGTATDTTRIIAPAAQTIFNELTGGTPGGQPSAITLGPDQALWFLDPLSNHIGQITVGGQSTQYPPPITPNIASGIPADAGLTGITAGPDGALWFTEANANQIGRISTTGAITQFSTGITQGARPTGITLGPDGNLWFTESGLPHIGQITPAGVVTEFSTGIMTNGRPNSITVGSDGNLWFTDDADGLIGRITPLGVITEFPGVTGVGLGSITSGSDGNLWFVEESSDKIGRINPVTFQVTEFTDPGIVGPNTITSAPDGNLWFTENNFGNTGNNSQIGRITTSGVVSTFAVGLTPNSNLAGITAGPDGNLYFAETAGDRIGQVILPGTSVATTPVTNLPDQAAGQPFTLTLARFTNGSSVANLTNFQGNIDWGDGTTSPASLSQTASGFPVVGTHTYASPGLYQGSVTIFNAANAATSVPILINVPAPLALTVTGTIFTVTQGAVFSGPVASFVDSFGVRPASAYSVTIDWGDGTPTTSGTVSPSPFPNSSALIVRGMHTYARAGVYQVGVTAQVTANPVDQGSGVSTASVVVSQLTATSVAVASTVNQPFDGLTALFHDQDPARSPANPALYTATIDWGDGTSTSPGTIGLFLDGLSVTGHHTYAQAGNFTVTTTIQVINAPDQAITRSSAVVMGTGTTPPPLSFVVTNVNDSGPGSLRQAILNANSVGGHTITFAILNLRYNALTISLQSPLPSVDYPSHIDGHSEAVFEGLSTPSPLVEVDGRAIIGPSAGFVFSARAAQSVIDGLGVFGFDGPQIDVEAPGVIIRGDILGLRIDPTITNPVSAPRLGVDGVLIRASGVIVGGLNPGDGNVISGNAGQGVEVSGPGATLAGIFGNIIGLDPSGYTARPNGINGLAIDGGAGFAFVGPGNLISGNGANGIALMDAQSVFIEGNVIGLDGTLTRSIANAIDGIDVGLASANVTIGASTPGGTNLISGNGLVGVAVQEGSNHVMIRANLIGTNPSGTAPIGNGSTGVLISESSQNVVGPGNLISGNGSGRSGSGVWIDGTGSVGNLVLGNSIGTDLSGTRAIPNAAIGLLINDASANQVEDNLISGNTVIGLMIAGPAASGNFVQANLIGSDASGLKSLGNGSRTSGDGVYILNAHNNIIGGIQPSSGNLISGNPFDGVEIFGPTATANDLGYNRIGVDYAGTGPLANGHDGVVLDGTRLDRLFSNNISANARNGVFLSTATGTQLSLNVIGQGVGGQILGNGAFGILIGNGSSGTVEQANLVLNNTLGPERNTDIAPVSLKPPISTIPSKSKAAVKIQSKAASFGAPSTSKLGGRSKR